MRWQVCACLASNRRQYDSKQLEKARGELGIDINKPNPLENKMAIEFKLPELGENIEGGDVVSVLVSAGDSISEGQSILEIEAGKASMEIPAPASGTISKLLIAQGDNVSVGQHVLTIEGEADAPTKEAAPEVSKPAPEPKPERKAEPKPEPN